MGIAPLRLTHDWAVQRNARKMYSRTGDKFVTFEAAKGRAILLALLTFVTVFCSHSVKAAGICDPHKALNDRAMDALNNRNFAETEKALKTVVAADPGDFRANEIKGLLTIYSAGKNHKQYLAGVVGLVVTATKLQSIPMECAKEGDYYRIYNTIGAEYFNDNDYEQAQQYFSMAFINKDKLSKQSLGWLHANLALLAFHDGDYGCALLGYRLAQALGNTGASVRDGLAKLNTIFTAALSKPPACKRNLI
jgi:Tfp pilus assembly protein PilF